MTSEREGKRERRSVGWKGPSAVCEMCLPLSWSDVANICPCHTRLPILTWIGCLLWVYLWIMNERVLMSEQKWTYTFHWRLRESGQFALILKWLLGRVLILLWRFHFSAPSYIFFAVEWMQVPGMWTVLHIEWLKCKHRLFVDLVKLSAVLSVHRTCEVSGTWLLPYFTQSFVHFLLYLALTGWSSAWEILHV